MSGLTIREAPLASAPAALLSSGRAPASAQAARPEPAAGPSPFARLLRGLGGEVARGEAVARGAERSEATSSLDPGQLIALQAGMYRYSEAIDLAARLVDHATTGLKTVLQGQ